MHNFRRGRSPRGDPHRDNHNDRRPASQDRVHDQPNEYYRSRHGYFRSPPRNDLPYDDLPEEDPRHHEDMSKRRNCYADSRDDYRGHRNRSGDGYRHHEDRWYERDRRNEDYSSRNPSRPRDRSRGYYDDPHSRHHQRRGSGSYAEDERYGRPRSRRRSRSYSYSRSPPRHPGSPSDTVILEGLPSDISVNELQSCVISSSTLTPGDFVDIRIPVSGGQRRAFIQFHTVNDAARFVDRNFPEILIDLPAQERAVDERISLYLHFARSRDEGSRRHPADDPWPCPSCDYSNFASRIRCKMCGYAQSAATSSAGYQQVLTGETDASNDPSQFLVVYPLDACVTEEVLEFGMKKLEVVEKQGPKDSDGPSKPLKSTAPSGDAPGYGARRGSLHRVFLIRDKSSGHTLKYGFAEFWTVEDAMAALTKFRMTRSFTIGGAPVAVFSIHMGVFVPEMQQPTTEDSKFSFVPLFNPSLRVKYWDPRVYASPRVINAEPPTKPEAKQEPEEANNNAETKKTKKRKADGSLNTGTAKKPVAMAGQMAMWQKKSEELRDGRNTDREEHQNTTGEGRTRSPPASSASDGPIKITLGGMAKAVANAPVPDRADSGHGTPEPSAVPKAEAPVSYADPDKVGCLLCMMKYKSLDELAIHERSGNHKKALADEDKVKAAAPRLIARDKRMQAKAKVEEDKPQYRDRAKERREVFNQPKKPAPQQNTTARPKPKGETAKAETKKPEPAPSKGSAMLAKMGWTGQGLGASGEGRTEIVAAKAYQEGVGLGVEGGVLGDAGEVAARRTEGGYKEYVMSAQEKARARYSQLNE